MIVQMVGAAYGGSTTAWAAALAADIRTGVYQPAAAGWIGCSSTTEPLSRRRSIEDDIKTVLDARAGAKTITPLACPMVWAQESNAYDCVSPLGSGGLAGIVDGSLMHTALQTNVFDYTQGADLCTGAYFEASIPIVSRLSRSSGTDP